MSFAVTSVVRRWNADCWRDTMTPSFSDELPQLLDRLWPPRTLVGHAGEASLKVSVDVVQSIPSAFMAAVVGSEKKIGSTRSTMSPDTSRKFRLFSRGMSARRAP